MGYIQTGMLIGSLITAACMVFKYKGWSAERVSEFVETKIN